MLEEVKEAEAKLSRQRKEQRRISRQRKEEKKGLNLGYPLVERRQLCL